MNKFKEHLKWKGYVIKGEIAVIGEKAFKIHSGNIQTAMGIQKSYWLELA